MLKELFGMRSGILEKLHEEHEEAAALLDSILEAGPKERAALFAELKEKLSVHLRAESKLLYAKLAKDADHRDFALEGNIEHDLARVRNKAGDEWKARVKVLKDLVEHHVEEEESRGFEAAREQFDGDQLETLEWDFAREKERMTASDGATPRRSAEAASAYAGRKPRAAAKARRAPARKTTRK